ncbi:uncharacterized protein MKK02DRAFT_39332 [Dioszegia hungarica]|uniref:Uncharacterized protein n=1 Tax=Dioszegia hungarica TaxID=4972 RepID=A0AA38H3P2_9TREE|nr:uncharacterized protein MKK02DRAFT_39332 [Dioszegia hungarica]KAI9633351.1 hypothetical protein MKK02DRAFT_39332 [Dioszegia hungarica]
MASWRNRVKRAASRCLPNARIILNATPTPPSLEAVKPLARSLPHFGILDLPAELVLLITRYTSGDPTALSDAQFSRLRKEAQGSEGLRILVKMDARLVKKYAEDGVMGYGAERCGEAGKRWRERQRTQMVMTDWLESGDWDKWERDA